MCKFCGGEGFTINTGNHLISGYYSTSNELNFFPSEKDSPCVSCNKITDNCVNNPCEKYKKWLIWRYENDRI